MPNSALFFSLETEVSDFHSRCIYSKWNYAQSFLSLTVILSHRKQSVLTVLLTGHLAGT